VSQDLWDEVQQSLRDHRGTVRTKIIGGYKCQVTNHGDVLLSLCRMALKMKHQDQAVQMGAIAPDYAGIERRGQRFPVRRLPALAPVAG
jgi:hypothetical protein